MAATPTECSVSRKAGFMLQILPCWSTMNIGKLMLSMFIVSPPCHGKHRVLAECSEGVRWEPTLAAATHRGHGGLLPRRGERRKSALSVMKGVPKRILNLAINLAKARIPD